MSRANTAEKFWAKVDKSGECWIWTGAKVGRGYGKIMFNRRHLRSHRLSWELTYGPIPDGLYVCHTCDNPACVRPDHLWLGTADDNNKDMARKGRSARGERSRAYTHPDTVIRGDAHYSRTNPEKVLRGDNHGMAKLSAEIVRTIREKLECGMATRKQLAKEYGVSNYAIYSIVKGLTWKHV